MLGLIDWQTVTKRRRATTWPRTSSSSSVVFTREAFSRCAARACFHLAGRSQGRL